MEQNRAPKVGVCTLEGQSSYFLFQGSPTSSSFCLLSWWQVIGKMHFSPLDENKAALIGSQFYFCAALRPWPIWKFLKIQLFLWQSWGCNDFCRSSKSSYTSSHGSWACTLCYWNLTVYLRPCVPKNVSVVCLPILQNTTLWESKN